MKEMLFKSRYNIRRTWIGGEREREKEKEKEKEKGGCSSGSDIHSRITHIITLSDYNKNTTSLQHHYNMFGLVSLHLRTGTSNVITLVDLKRLFTISWRDLFCRHSRIRQHAGCPEIQTVKQFPTQLGP